LEKRDKDEIATLAFSKLAMTEGGVGMTYGEKAN